MTNKESHEQNTQKEFNFFLAMIPLTVMVLTMLYAIVVLETDPHLPLIIVSRIVGGVVATMIYYGLMIISPQYYLVTISIICSIVSLAIGSSWSTMATIGVAGMRVGMKYGN